MAIFITIPEFGRGKPLIALQEDHQFNRHALRSSHSRSVAMSPPQQAASDIRNYLYVIEFYLT